MDILQELLNNINAILQIEEADNERDKKNGNSLNLFSSHYCPLKIANRSLK